MKPVDPAIHYYAPIPYYGGAVLKYQGMASAENRTWMHEKHPGLIELPDYLGDRITADTHQLYEGF